MNTTALRRGPLEAASHEAFLRLFPLFEPPSGELVDADLLAAFGEGLLLPDEAAEVISIVRRSPAARSEFRELFPERYAEIFSPEAVALDTEPAGGKLLQFPKRLVVIASATLTAAAAAAAAFFMLPSSPPEGAFLAIAPVEVTRGHDHIQPSVIAAANERFQLLMKLGTASRFDKLRGKSPFGLLFEHDARGQARLVCTSDDSECTSSDGSMSHLYVVPETAGYQRLIFVSGVGTIDLDKARSLESGATDWASFSQKLKSIADEAAWEVHEPQLIDVR